MSDGKNTGNSKMLALSGILLALAVLLLFLATILPTNRLSLYALSSFFVSILVIEYGVKAAWLFYSASCLLGLIIVQNKPGLLPYVIFFGIYGIIKYYIEKINNIVIEYVIKIIYFNLCLAAAIFLVKELFLKEINVKLPWFIIIAAFELIFLVYDYVYTLFIKYYREKLKKLLKV